MKDLTYDLNCHPVLASLLVSRGIDDAKKANSFLNPDLNKIINPFLLKDMQKAVQRIFIAINNKEKILVFGDFDADGITSTSLLSSFLESLDTNVSWYIPHRIKEGYSLQLDHIQMILKQNIDLIITVDCGIASHEAVKKAKSEDIDVIIIDHHEPETTLPCAFAIVNPKQKDCKANLNYLAGVGVTFFLVMALRKFLRQKGYWKDKKEPNLTDYLDLFAIGTMADMVPLLNENRILCIKGIEKIKSQKRIGIKILAQNADIDIKQIDSDDISFKLIPRINAAGRLSHARICVSLLTSDDITNALSTSALLNKLNKKRQIIEKEIIVEIEAILEKNNDLLKNKILILCNDKWEQSVLGIAASRLARKYFCPVILLSGKDDYAIGSGRSVNQINIHKALFAHKDLLERFGGHAMAAGLTIKKENLPKFREKLNTYIKQTYCKEDFLKTLTIDAILDFEDINMNLVGQIESLKPFGAANPKPVFLCKNIKVISSFLIGDKHRKMMLSNGLNHTIEAFHFNITNPYDLPDYYDKIFFELRINTYKKTPFVQIIIIDI